MSSESSSSSINLDEINESWKVLLVDDESDILEQAEVFLEKEDDRLKVVTAVSAEEGLELMDEYKFDIIVSDYQMPSMNGLELLKVVRKEKESNIPFIMFTGKGREEVAMEALNLGADRYLQKGGDPRSQYGVLARAIIQEVKHAEAMREKTKVEAELSSLVKGSEDPIYIVDEDCRFTFANHAELERHGLEREELVGKRFHDLHPDRDSRKFMEKVKKTLQTGENQRQEIKHQADGRYYVRTLSPIENPETGEVDRVSVISKDITDRMEKEKKLRGSEERFRSIFEGLDVAVFVVLSGEQNYGKILEVNPAAEKLLGYSRGVLVGRNILDFVSEEEEKITGTLEDGERRHFVQKKVRNDGTEIWTEVNLVPFEYGGRETHLSIQRDITEQKEAEKELRKLEREKSLILESTDEIIAYHDTDHNLIWANQAYSEATGESVEEMKGRKCYEIWLGRKESCEGCPVDKALETGESERGEMSPPGEEKDWLVWGSPVKDEGGNIIGAIETTLDITERKEKQKKLDFKTDLLNDLMDNIPDIIYFKDEDARFVEVSQSKAEEVGEENRGDLYGKTDFDYYPEERAEKSYKDDMRVIEEKKPVIQREERHETPEGENYWLEAIKVPRYDDEGNVTGVLGISRNITGRKEAEEREEFLHSLLRHDVRNKAQIAEGYFELLREEDLSEQGREYLEKTKKACDEAVEIIEKVRKLREIEKDSEIEEVGLQKVIGEVIDEHEDQLSEKSIELDCEELEQKVKGGSLLKELFSNLVENAIRHSDCDKIRIHGGEQNDECIITVEDDGCGIPEEDRERIFERGYKKEETGGSGLGLYLVKEIAESYGGKIEFKDPELEGTRFDVYLKKA